jgi:hypothetical protein
MKAASFDTGSMSMTPRAFVGTVLAAAVSFVFFAIAATRNDLRRTVKGGISHVQDNQLISEEARQMQQIVTGAEKESPPPIGGGRGASL